MLLLFFGVVIIIVIIIIIIIDVKISLVGIFNDKCPQKALQPF